MRPAEGQSYPVVVSTWPFVEAVRAAWRSVNDGGWSAVDAVVDGCSTCEELRCDGTVGPGGSPDENGETTLDALVMNGATMEVGAVAAMRYVKDGIKAAKLVMEYTEHTLLVGEKASVFAISMGLPGPTNLSSPESIEKWIKWKENNCQPNFWKNVIPANCCGPYHISDSASTALENSCGLSKDGIGEGNWSDGNNLLGLESNSKLINLHNHDTISMAVIDKVGHIAVGTSTNGATFKIPGSSYISCLVGLRPEAIYVAVAVIALFNLCGNVHLIIDMCFPRGDSCKTKLFFKHQLAVQFFNVLVLSYLDPEPFKEYMHANWKARE